MSAPFSEEKYSNCQKIVSFFEKLSAPFSEEKYSDCQKIVSFFFAIVADLHRFTEGLLISRPVNYEGAPLSALENVGGALENVGKFLYFFFFWKFRKNGKVLKKAIISLTKTIIFFTKSVEKSHFFLNKNVQKNVQESDFFSKKCN